MPEYILDPGADDDLWDIWRFIARDNPKAASKVIVAAHRTFDLLASSPKLGKTRQLSLSTKAQIRSCPVSGYDKYIIFYQPVAEGIRVLRVYHSRRDIETLFAKE